jgi:hypothetical protein
MCVRDIILLRYNVLCTYGFSKPFPQPHGPPESIAYMLRIAVIEEERFQVEEEHASN